ncbi:helix-turn-helix domain-containing protein [Halomonas sp. TBZ9]|uniref:Helix-turn-helix domain-containing protein n=1 Tax=Vreelandella azerica TaxID=2732867 RepID=A0A7Y3TX28_9GAMM|nr:helix-turn-helix domain-containing protein [Halomonas azerica]NOG31644.1 helix-turn-helix domain-containing protein [Halomonas azerica]
MTKHLSPEKLNERRIKAVQLRLDGLTVVQVCERTGLSAPTVSAAWKAFREGGWAAVPVRPRGRHKGQANVLAPALKATLWQCLHELPPVGEPGWNSADLAQCLEKAHSQPVSQRAVEHWWEEEHLKREAWPLGSLSKERSMRGRWYRQAVAPVFKQLNSAAQRWQGGVRHLSHPDGSLYQIYLHGSRGRLWMRSFRRPPVAEDYLITLKALAANGPAALVFHGAALSAAPELTAWLAAQRDFWLVPVPADIGLVPGESVRAGAKSTVFNNCISNGCVPHNRASNNPDSNSKQVKR